MAAALLDTHVWAWLLVADGAKLTSRAALAVSTSEIWISPVSIYEIVQKVRLGKWPEMEAASSRLLDALSDSNANAASVTPEIADLAGRLDWDHRDPFDRLIAATALAEGLTLISADQTFDAVPGLRRVWD